MNPIPKVREDDPEDVSWALSTAATQFARGDRVEALKWLRRAAEAASEAEQDSRALELAKAAADLSTVPETTPKAAPVEPKAAPKPPAAAKRSSGGKSKAKPGPNETQPLRPPPADLITGPVDVPVRAAEADAWPTEPTGHTDLDALGDVYGQERTRIGALPYRPDPEQTPFRASQAVQVIVWRDADGTLRIAPKGTAVSAVTIDALLVAPAPDVDLLAWLSPA